MTGVPTVTANGAIGASGQPRPMNIANVGPQTLTVEDVEAVRAYNDVLLHRSNLALMLLSRQSFCKGDPDRRQHKSKVNNSHHGHDLNVFYRKLTTQVGLQGMNA